MFQIIVTLLAAAVLVTAVLLSAHILKEDDMLDDNHDSERLAELGSTVEVYADRLASVEHYDGLAHLVFDSVRKIEGIEGNRRDCLATVRLICPTTLLDDIVRQHDSDAKLAAPGAASLAGVQLKGWGTA